MPAIPPRAKPSQPRAAPAALSGRRQERAAAKPNHPSISARFLLTILREHANVRGDVAPTEAATHAKISSWFGPDPPDERTVARWMRQLRAAGAISVTRGRACLRIRLSETAGLARRVSRDHFSLKNLMHRVHSEISAAFDGCLPEEIKQASWLLTTLVMNRADDIRSASADTAPLSLTIGQRPGPEIPRGKSPMVPSPVASRPAQHAPRRARGSASHASPQSARQQDGPLKGLSTGKDLGAAPEIGSDRQEKIRYCDAHLARLGVRVPAIRIFAGDEALCKSCLEGEPTRPLESREDLSDPEEPKTVREARDRAKFIVMNSADDILSAPADTAPRSLTIPPGPEIPREKSPMMRPLSEEEKKQVAALISKGLRNPEIAERLGVTERVVKFHIASIFRKSGTANPTAFVQALSRNSSSRNL